MVARWFGLAFGIVFAGLASRPSFATPSAPAPAAPERPRPSTTTPSLQRVVLDLKGDGLDLGRCDASTRHRAPTATTDDRLLVIDVADAARFGYRVVASHGTTGRFVFLGSGLRLTVPAGTTHEPDTGWAVLALVETTRDGVLDKNDLFWAALRLARDTNGDGVIQDGELESLAANDLAGIGVRAPATAERDKHGNELAYGAFVRADRSIGRMADVALASCER